MSRAGLNHAKTEEKDHHKQFRVHFTTCFFIKHIKKLQVTGMMHT